MNIDSDPEKNQTVSPAPQLSPEAQRALAEAEVRRQKALEQETSPRPREINGRSGPEPVRYQDWEVKGIATDF